MTSLSGLIKLLEQIEETPHQDGSCSKIINLDLDPFDFAKLLDDLREAHYVRKFVRETLTPPRIMDL